MVRDPPDAARTHLAYAGRMRAAYARLMRPAYARLIRARIGLAYALTSPRGYIHPSIHLESTDSSTRARDNDLHRTRLPALPVYLALDCPRAAQSAAGWMDQLLRNSTGTQSRKKTHL